MAGEAALPPTSLSFELHLDTASCFPSLVLGEVRDTEKGITTKYGITKFPALIVIPKGSAEHEVYDGPLQQEVLSTFLSKFAAPPKPTNNNQQQQQQQQQEAPKEVCRSLLLPFLLLLLLLLFLFLFLLFLSRLLLNVPSSFSVNPEIIKLTTQEQFKEECLDKPVGMCLLSFMIVEPEFEESVTLHNQNLEALKAVKKATYNKSMPFRVFEVDALEEKALMDKFMLSDQVPSLLLLSPTKKVYRPFTAGFDTESIMSFLEETSKAKGRHFKYDFVPSFSA